MRVRQRERKSLQLLGIQLEPAEEGTMGNLKGREHCPDFCRRGRQEGWLEERTFALGLERSVTVL